MKEKNRKREKKKKKKNRKNEIRKKEIRTPPGLIEILFVNKNINRNFLHGL